MIAIAKVELDVELSRLGCETEENEELSGVVCETEEDEDLDEELAELVCETEGFEEVERVDEISVEDVVEDDNVVDDVVDIEEDDIVEDETDEDDIDVIEVDDVDAAALVNVSIVVQLGYLILPVEEARLGLVVHWLSLKRLGSSVLSLGALAPLGPSLMGYSQVGQIYLLHLLRLLHHLRHLRHLRHLHLLRLLHHLRPSCRISSPSMALSELLESRSLPAFSENRPILRLAYTLCIWRAKSRLGPISTL